MGGDQVTVSRLDSVKEIRMFEKKLGEPKLQLTYGPRHGKFMLLHVSVRPSYKTDLNTEVLRYFLARTKQIRITRFYSDIYNPCPAFP